MLHERGGKTNAAHEMPEQVVLMKSGGFVLDKHQRQADRWLAQYGHWLALLTKESEAQKGGKKTGTGKQAFYCHAKTTQSPAVNASNSMTRGLGCKS